MISKKMFILNSTIYLTIAILITLPIIILAILALPYMLLAKAVNKKESGYVMWMNAFKLPLFLIKEEIDSYKLLFH